MKGREAALSHLDTKTTKALGKLRCRVRLGVFVVLVVFVSLVVIVLKRLSLCCRGGS
jgi:hypothetical protein